MTMSLTGSMRKLSVDNSDEVFSTVEAKISPSYRKQVSSLENVLVMVEEYTSVEIRFSRGAYVLIGRWEQVERAKCLLEESMFTFGTVKGSSGSSHNSDQDISSFEVLEPFMKEKKSENRWQEDEQQANMNDEMLKYEADMAKESAGARVSDSEHMESMGEKDKEMHKTKEDEQLPPGAKVQKSEAGLNSSVEHSGVRAAEKMSDQKVEPLSRTEEVAFSEQAQPVSVVEVTGMTERGAKNTKDEVELDKESRKMTTEESKNVSGLLDDDIYPDIACNEPIFVDTDIFEYLLDKGKIKAIKDLYGVDILLKNEQSEHPSVLFVTTKGQSEALMEVLTAREEFIGIYENTLSSCVKEICELPEVKCAQEAFVETVFNYPDIFVKQCGMKSNRFIFIGPQAMAKKCCHFFKCCVDKPLEKSKVVNAIDRECLSKDCGQLKPVVETFQCEEARQFSVQNAGMITRSSGGAADFEYSDLPELEPVDIDEALVMEKILMAEIQEAPMKKQPVVEVLPCDEESEKRECTISQSNSLTDRQTGVGLADSSAVRELTKVKSHEDDRSEKLPDAAWKKPELVTFKEQVYCQQCAGLGKKYVRLSCSHEFCIACMQNPSCVSNSCPDCGESFSREELNNLWQAESGGTVSSSEAAVSSQQMATRPGKIINTDVSRSEFKPEMQQDGTYVCTSKGQVCSQCVETYDWLVMLKCCHSFCYNCVNQTNPLQFCPQCGKTTGRCVFDVPAVEISHNLQKDYHLPAFPKDGTLLITITIPEGKLKIDDDWSVKYHKASITTYLPNNGSGRQLYKNLIAVDKSKKLFKVVPISRQDGIVVTTEKISFAEDQEAVTQEYMETILKKLKTFSELP